MKITEKILEGIVSKTLNKGLTVSVNTTPELPKGYTQEEVMTEEIAAEETDRRDEKIALLTGILIGIGVTFVAMRSVR